MSDDEKFVRGRGAQQKINNRFFEHHYDESDTDGLDEEKEWAHKTNYIPIFPKKIVNKVTSPDVAMEYSLNPYQGCEHGCTYCFARNTHEYWGYGLGLDFEQKILIKENAPALLEEQFLKKSWNPETIVISGNTDCYQPAERKFGITRKLLETCLKFKNPVGIITKNSLITRDLDILQELAKLNLIVVNLSINSCQEEIRRKLEPRTATYKRRIATVEALSGIGVPVNVLVAPIIPGINSKDIPTILKDTSNAGANSAGFILVRLNGGIGNLFTDWINKYFPDRANKVLNLIKSCRDGKLNDSRWGMRMKGQGNYSEQLHQLFKIHYKKYFPNPKKVILRKDLFTRPQKNGQLKLF